MHDSNTQSLWKSDWSVWHLLPIFLAVCMSAVTAGEVTSFTLVNASSNSDITTLNSGASIDLGATGSSLNIRANISGTASKVNFTLSGAMSRTQSEGVAPYALYGDSSGNYNSWTPVAGSYTLTANCDGAGAKTITFTVADGEQPPPPNGSDGDGTVTISGETKRWHKVTLTIDGPFASETGTPNPFLDYRMDVTFTNGSLSYTVPGYFAADGDAANTSATSGIKWRAHLSPDLTGTWTYSISFKSGTNCAVNGGGASVSPYNGKTGTFTVTETDKTGADLRARGRLQYVGKHHLRFKGDGKYFLKEGADAPENFLAYADFDGPFKTDGQKDNLVKTWGPHIADWQTGDPTWQNGKGKGIIGAINYLASESLDSFSFLTMNINGDDRNVFPYLSYGERTRLDCSRLDQWAIVFEHGTKMGMYLHFKTQETENELLLDSGNLGVQRKLYYRELIARFSHNLALNWNLGEEINNATTAQKVAWAQYFYDTDPYHHNIVIHNGSNHYDLLGNASKLTGFSLQTNLATFANVHAKVKDYLDRSDAAGKPWVVACDEPGDASYALRPDSDPGNSHEDGRKNALWGSLMAGGTGCEWYFGYKLENSDLTCQDFRSRDNWWDYCRYALQFFRNNNIPFQDMKNDDALSTNTNDYCFYKSGDTYVVYLKAGGSTSLNLSGVSGTYNVHWYDPRNGGALKQTSIKTVTGGGTRNLGSAPNNTSLDWAILIRKSTGTNTPPTASFTVPTDGQSYDAPATIDLVDVAATDADGSIANVKLYLDGAFVRQENVIPYQWNPTKDTVLANMAAGNHTLRAVATDNQGATGEATITVTVQGPNSPPTVSFASPSNGDTILESDPLTVVVNAADSDGSISNVKLYLDGAFVRQENLDPYKWSDDVLQSLSVGNHTLKAVATDNEGATSNASITITVDDGSQTVAAAINCGGPAFTAADGTLYQADDLFSGGKTYSTGAAIAGTVDDKLYQSERYGNYTYSIPVANGSYEVTLQMAEIYWSAAGKRVFDVKIEGQVKVNDMDLYATAGKNVAVDRTFTVDVTDGVLNIQAVTITNNAKLSAILVKGGSAPANNPPVIDSEAWADPATIQLGGSTMLSVFASDADGDNLTYSWSKKSGPGTVSFDSANQDTSSASFSAAGDYVLEVTVSDGKASVSSECSVTVSAIAQNPEAIIMHDAYLENGVRKNDSYLKVEPGRRISYIQFNVTALQSTPSSVKLKLKVQGDPGNGTIRIYAGSHSNWTETNLTTSNAPAAGAQVASRTGSWVAGTTYEFELKSMITDDGDYSIVIKMDSGGNDAWFGSDESTAKPTITITQ